MPYLRDTPLTYFDRIYYFPFFYKKILPLYKGRTFIKNHFILQKREIQIYQKYTYSTLSLEEKKEVLKEEII